MTSDTNTADAAIAGGALFDAIFHATGCGKPYSRNQHEIVRSLRPTRVFDAGCAMGMLVELLWERRSILGCRHLFPLHRERAAGHASLLPARIHNGAVRGRV
jgi:hypothetical protein